MYRKSMLDTLMKIPYQKYVYIGTYARHLLIEQGYKGGLCTKFKVFHSDPHYAFLFDQLDSEINKYHSIGRVDMVAAYEKRAETKFPRREKLEQALQHAFRVIDALTL